MSKMQDFMLSRIYNINEVSAIEYQAKLMWYGFTKVYRVPEIMDLGLYPKADVCVILNESGLGASESDPSGRYVLQFAFKYGGKYYIYSDNG